MTHYENNDNATRAAIALGNAPRCDHRFASGLCVHCGCPETNADTDAAIRAFYRKEHSAA